MNKVYLTIERESDNIPKIWLIIGIIVGSIANITLFTLLIILCKKREKRVLPILHNLNKQKPGNDKSSDILFFNNGNKRIIYKYK